METKPHPSLRKIFIILVLLMFLCVILYTYYKPKKKLELLLPSPSLLKGDKNDSIIKTVLPVEPPGSPKVILFWTSCFGFDFIKAHGLRSGEIECGKLKYKCFVTNDKKRFSNSSAVIFHSPSGDFMSTLPHIRSLKRPPEQRWIYYNRESPPKSPGPSAMKQWNSLLNWTMTYKLNSDIRYPYGDIIPNVKFKGGFDPKKNYLQGRNKTAVTLISNCVKHRLELVRKLGKYIDVDIYGNCGKSCQPRDSCYSLIPQYKFYLAFENNICRDYITEKSLSNAIGKSTVPVIVSGANLSNPAIIPPKSYINARNFKTAKELADHLKHIGSQPQLYNEYFKWRDHWSIHYTGSNSTDLTCRVCKKLYEPNQQVKIYYDIASWHTTEHDCISYPVWN